MTKEVRKYKTFIVSGIITIMVLSFGATTYLKAVNYAETARGVDVYLVTAEQTAETGNYFVADVFITNDQTPLNAMEAEIYFDPDLFAVTDFAFGTSLCENRFILDNVIDNANGRLHMSCGTITPFSGNAAIFGTITAIPLKSGITNLTFGEQTHVHVHDGLGTEIVRDTYDETIVIELEA